MSDLDAFPTIEAVPMPVAAKPTAPEPGTLKATALASFVAIRTHAAKLAERYRAVAFDVTTPKGMAAAKDARLELREEGRFAVQRLRDRLKDEANDLKRVVTDEAEAVIKIIAPVEDAIHAQITAEEDRKKAEKAEAARILAERQQKQTEGVAGIRGYLIRAQTTPGMTAALVANGITLLQGMTFPADEWLDPVAAANTQCETLEGMRTLHATLQAREEEAARLEEQRRQQEAERAELERQAAVMRAEQARITRLQAMIAEIRAAATGHERATAADLYEARVAVAALDTSEATYAEFAMLAHATQQATLAVLDKFHAEATDREAAEAQRRAEVERVLSTPLPLTIPDEPELLAQDECRELSKALAADPAAPLHAREAAAAIQNTQPGAPTPDAQDGVAQNPVQSQPGACPFTLGDATAESVAGDEAAATAVDSPAPGVTTSEPTMTLGEFNAFIAPLKIDSAGLELLGFKVARTFKAAKYYNDTDRSAIVAALVKHLQGL